MLIRAYTVNDAEALTEIWYTASLAAHSFIPKELWDSHKGDLQAKYLPAAQTWVAEEMGKPAGFISLMGNYIGGLFVDTSVQGKGIGSSLIKHIQNIRDTLTVSVYEKNSGARRFYEAHGFLYQKEELQEETGQIQIEMAWHR